MCPLSADLVISTRLEFVCKITAEEELFTVGKILEHPGIREESFFEIAESAGFFQTEKPT